MRGLFILLLLSNAALLVWQLVTPVQDGGNESGFGVPVINEGLTLLAELAPGERPPVRESVDEELSSPASHKVESTLPNRTETTVEQGRNAEPGNDGAGNGLCLRVEVIDSDTELQSLLSVLEQNEARIIGRGEKQGTKANYWVMLPPYPNRTKADEAAAILNRKKIKDFFIVRSGEYENAVSLGVFSERERAERRFAQIVELKVRLRKPTIETIALPAKHSFVIFSAVDETSQSHILEQMKALGYPSIAKVACK